MIPFRFLSSLKQYNSKKPHLWGNKIFALTGVSGFCMILRCSVVLLTTSSYQVNLTSMQTANVVMRLAHTLYRQNSLQLSSDNWFTSIPVQASLKNEGIDCFGLMWHNCILGHRLPKETKRKKEHMKKDMQCSMTKLSAVAWHDKTVTILSLFACSILADKLELDLQHAHQQYEPS